LQSAGWALWYRGASRRDTPSSGPACLALPVTRGALRSFSGANRLFTCTHWPPICSYKEYFCSFRS
jgi:hypothetical protein